MDLWFSPNIGSYVSETQGEQIELHSGMRL